MTVRVYLSVSDDPNDLDLLAELRQHLVPVVRHGWAVLTSASDIAAGLDKRGERLRLLASADLILLLMSPTYVAAHDAEASEALRQARRGAVVIPVRLRPCSYKDEPYAQLAALPDSGEELSRRLPEERQAALVALVEAVAARIRELAARSGPIAAAPLPPPAGAYHPHYYVRRPDEESRALGQLAAQGALVLQGPRDFGKSTLLGHLLATFTAQQPRARPVRLDLGQLEQRHPQALTSEGALLRHLARELLQTLRPQASADADADAAVAEAFARPGTDPTRLLRLLEALLPEADPLVLCLEQVDRIHDRPYQTAFLAMLRAWILCDRAPWDRLRLVVTTATEPALLQSTDASAFFIASTCIEVPPFDLAQAQALAAQYGLPPPLLGLAEVHRRVGGHPLLLRLWLHEARCANLPLLSVKEWTVVRGHLLSLRRQIEREALLPDLRCAVAGEELPLEEYGALHRLGLITSEGVTGARFRSPLYEDFARELCHKRS